MRCPQIVRNCSRERSLEHCHSHAFLVPKMNGGSSAPYLARTPCTPLFSTLLNRCRNRRAFRLPGAGGGSFPLWNLRPIVFGVEFIQSECSQQFFLETGHVCLCSHDTLAAAAFCHDYLPNLLLPMEIMCDFDCKQKISCDCSCDAMLQSGPP